jgi:putative integral membrane protein (TIGR02587 family)
MAARTATKNTTPPDVMRGVAGAVLLGVPLLYTQEVWDHGATLDQWVILGLLALTFGLSVALSYVVGFRPGRTHHPFEDAVVGAGVAMVLAFLLLWLLHRIQLDMPLENLFGIVALTSIPMGLGFAIGNALAPQEGGEGSEKMEGGPGDLLAAAGGAVVLALNIAPTEEPVRLGQELDWLRLALIVVVSLALPYLIVFEAEFGGRHLRRAQDGATQSPETETFLAYLVAFTLSAGLLWAFGRLDGIDGPALASVVVLAFPASLGAALGRMLV